MAHEVQVSGALFDRLPDWLRLSQFGYTQAEHCGAHHLVLTDPEEGLVRRLCLALKPGSGLGFPWWIWVRLGPGDRLQYCLTVAAGTEEVFLQCLNQAPAPGTGS